MKISRINFIHLLDLSHLTRSSCDYRSYTTTVNHHLTNHGSILRNFQTLVFKYIKTLTWHLIDFLNCPPPPPPAGRPIHVKWLIIWTQKSNIKSFATKIYVFFPQTKTYNFNSPLNYRKTVHVENVTFSKSTAGHWIVGAICVNTRLKPDPS